MPIVDRQIVSEINKKAEELIGFTQAQFSQIVMLPQGEFRKFLTSDTENKETIMRKIFKTETYREIVERLKVKKEEAQAALLQESQQSKGLIKQIASQLPPRNSTIFSVLANENHNVNQVIEGLEEEQLFYAEKIVSDKNNYETAYKNHSKMLDKYHEAKGINERFNELAQRKETFTALSNKIPFLEKEAKRLSGAEHAVSIEQIEIQFLELKIEESRKREHLVKTTQTVQVVTDELEKIETQYKAEEAKKPEREKITERLIRLNDSLPKVAELASKKEALTKMQKELSKLELTLKDTIENSAIETEKVTSTKNEIEQLDNKLSSFDEKVERLTNTIEKCRIVDEYLVLIRRALAFVEEKNKHELAYVAYKKHYEKLANDWLLNEAATLAEALHDGDACPVCGSVEHPEKAHRGDVEVTKEELETANPTACEN